MPAQTTNLIASDAEVQAVIADAEADPGHIPNLDDGSPISAVAIPVEANIRPLPRRADPQPSDSPRDPAESTEPLSGGQGDATALPQAASGVIYRMIDVLLGAINWPFAWLGPDARRMTGLIAMVTIVLSLSALLLPTLFPRPDPLKHSRPQAPATSTPPPAQTEH